MIIFKPETKAFVELPNVRKVSRIVQEMCPHTIHSEQRKLYRCAEVKQALKHAFITKSVSALRGLVYEQQIQRLTDKNHGWKKMFQA